MELVFDRVQTTLPLPEHDYRSRTVWDTCRTRGPWPRSAPGPSGNETFCTSCFTGDYPVPMPEEGREQLRLFEKVRD